MHVCNKLCDGGSMVAAKYRMVFIYTIGIIGMLIAMAGGCFLIWRANSNITMVAGGVTLIIISSLMAGGYAYHWRSRGCV